MKPNAIIRFACVLACAGVLHVYGANAATETVIYSFQGSPDGGDPTAPVIDVNGTLYGTTYFGGTSTACAGGCGTVFAVTTNAGIAEIVLHTFSGKHDGASPYAGLIYVNGALYGTTMGGGDYGKGTLFSINPTTGALKVLHTFRGGTDDSSGSYGSLIDVQGTLYGTGGYGRYSGGTIFSINPTSPSTFKVLHSFPANTYPSVSLLYVGGTLYGTSPYGGDGNTTTCGTEAGCGTVFSFNPKTDHEVLLHSFGSKSDDGYAPLASLIDVNGTLYGTTYEGGGPADGGTIFSINPTTGAEKVLYSFCRLGGKTCTDGANPQAGLTNVNGTLYGTTYAGGAKDEGTVFSFDLSTGKETVQWSFQSHSSTDGFYPFAGLIAVNGTLYGTTTVGGTSNCTHSTCEGTVFSVKP